MIFAQFNLHPAILKALQHCGYQDPTPVQERSIPDILNGKDVVASAQTGTGKTASFVLPALQLLTQKKASSSPRILILAPTRELANQITQAIITYAKFIQCKVISLVGGMSYREQQRGLSRSIDIIVATPGRLLDHLRHGRVNLSHIEMLVLDEADRMLDMGFIDDVQEIANKTPRSRQTLLFSATIDRNLTELTQKLLKKPLRIDLSQHRIYANAIKQEIYLVDNSQHKKRLLVHLLENAPIYKAIIFLSTKIHAHDLAKYLCKLNYKAAALHGDLKQNVRNKNIEYLRCNKIQYLVATDVAARGIDINDITHVINYDLPKFSEDYVHRIGRTGRAGKSGIAISFAAPFDNLHLKKIERFTKQLFDFRVIPGLEPITNISRDEKKSGKSIGHRKKHKSRIKKKQQSKQHVPQSRRKRTK